jgi:hypothetical protein
MMRDSDSAIRESEREGVVIVVVVVVKMCNIVPSASEARAGNLAGD